MQIEKISLQGTRIVLEPLSKKHLPSLAIAIEDGKLWQLPVTFVPHPNDLPQFLAAAQTQFQAQKELTFVIIDIKSGKLIGSTRFRCIELAHKRVEIGFTFIAQSWQRSYVNTEAKYLMLRHAFEQWGFNRVELLTDVLNTKSRNAIVRIGAREEGVLYSHMVMRDGRIRDSVIFSIVARDWIQLRSKLEERLAMI